MNFAARSIAGTIGVLVLSVAVLVLGADRSLRRDLHQDTLAALQREARLVREGLSAPPDSATWPEFVRHSAAASGLRITLISDDGRVVAESDPTGLQLERIANHADRAEVRAALDSGLGSDIRQSATVGRSFMYVAVVGGPGVVRVAMPYDRVEATVSRAQRLVLAAAGLALVLGIVLAWLASRRIARPLEEIGAAAQGLALGQAPQLNPSGIPDIDRLANHLRDTHAQLASRFDDLQRRQSETAAIVDAMVEGVLASNDRGDVVMANPAARRLLGFGPSDQLPGLPLIFRSKEARDVVDTVLAGRPVADREITQGGRTYLLNARPLPNGGSVLVMHDLSEVKHLEAVRRDFVANASHELKTPLTAIRGYAETLLADQPEPTVAKQFLETILANAERMQRLVDDQLDLSRVESGSWVAAIERTAIEPAAQEAWTIGAPQNRGGPTLRIEVEPGADFVAADPDALRQVFRNLFENAVRYTPATGQITVLARTDGPLVKVSVRDTGTGIAAEHLPRLFERFYRVDPSRSREQGGTGLGLAIVKHLVEAQGGRVAAESQLGDGTTIHTWWPVA